MGNTWLATLGWQPAAGTTTLVVPPVAPLVVSRRRRTHARLTYTAVIPASAPASAEFL
jgi:hypothetical protein